MANLKEEIATYEKMCNDLETDRFEKWVMA